MLPLLPIAAGISIVSGIANFFANQSAAERAAALQNKALEEWMKLQIPDPKEQQIALKNFVQEGVLDPRVERAIQANPSEFQSIVTNPKYAAAQDRALGELEDIGYEGGLRLQDKATLQDAMMDSQVKDRAGRDQIAAEMARRGQGGSGFDVAARLQNQQATSDRNANNSLKIAAMAQDRGLAAIQAAGDMSSKYRAQDFGEKAQKASAADKINLFNTTNLQDVQQRNLAVQNSAAASNLAQKQKTSDLNTNQSNYEQEYNKKLVQQNFENQAKKTAGMTGQYGNLANNALLQGQNAGNFYSNMGSGLANAATSQAKYDRLDAYLNSKNRTKLDEDGEVDDSWYG